VRRRTSTVVISKLGYEQTEVGLLRFILGFILRIYSWVDKIIMSVTFYAVYLNYCIPLTSS
jgi:hypothetical protein